LWKNQAKDTTHRAIEDRRSADILSARAQRADFDGVSCARLSALRALADRMSAIHA
jgi:hypothetical protein